MPPASPCRSVCEPWCQLATAWRKTEGRRLSLSLIEEYQHMGRGDMPRPIAAFLDSGFGWFVARLVLTFVFWGAGIGHLVDFQVSVAELRALSLEPAPLMNVILVATLLVGSILILLDRWLWLGAGILSGFLVVA